MKVLYIQHGKYYFYCLSGVLICCMMSVSIIILAMHYDSRSSFSTVSYVVFLLVIAFMLFFLIYEYIITNDIGYIIDLDSGVYKVRGNELSIIKYVEWSSIRYIQYNDQFRSYAFHEECIHRSRASLTIYSKQFPKKDRDRLYQYMEMLKGIYPDLFNY